MALAGLGLSARKDYGTVPRKFEDRVRPVGHSFAPLIASIRNWGVRHLGAA